jgi:hypothetical protein
MSDVASIFEVACARWTIRAVSSHVCSVCYDLYMVEVTVQKYRLPTLWLDTSIFSHAGKLRADKRIPDAVRLRVERLVRGIKGFVREGQLFCVCGDQDEEIVLSNSNYVEPIREMVTQLTWEVKLNHRQAILDRQMYFLMDAYLKGQHEVTLEFEDAARQDLATQTRNALPFAIRVDWPCSDESKDEVRGVRSRVTDGWENLRQRNVAGGVTFDEQKKLELQGFRDAVITSIRQAAQRGVTRQFDHTDLLRTHFWTTAFMYWRRLTADVGDISGFLRFLQSEHYFAAPQVEVASTLCADLLTGKPPIDRGDGMDVSQLAAVLPYVHFVVADNAMVGRIKRRRVDQEYGTRVFALRDVESLIRAIEDCID